MSRPSLESSNARRSIWTGRGTSGGAPGASLVVGVGGIIGLSQIGPVAYRHEPLQFNRQQLTPEAQREPGASHRLLESDEGLFHIESILVDWCEHLLAWRKCTLQLSKHLHVVAEPEIGVHLQAAEEPLALKTRQGAKKWCVIDLDTLTEVESEGEVGSWAVWGEREVFEAVQRFSLDSRIREHGPILVPSAVGKDRRSLGNGGYNTCLRGVLCVS